MFALEQGARTGEAEGGLLGWREGVEFGQGAAEIVERGGGSGVEFDVADFHLHADEAAADAHEVGIEGEGAVVEVDGAAVVAEGGLGVGETGVLAHDVAEDIDDAAGLEVERGGGGGGEELVVGAAGGFEALGGTGAVVGEAEDFAAGILCAGEGEEDGLIVGVGLGEGFRDGHGFVEAGNGAGLVAEILLVGIRLKVGETDEGVDETDLG